ncbi:MAG TPA: xanthine dehydrogenase family protein molybdopterin-binding subunit [Candidatus Dormibacteraeota bacterium]|nr:xanthine dehydrogenase family protein molybdopterin-binding subunit [Candidatus Dormibacteraeota bacterium]
MIGGRVPKLDAVDKVTGGMRYVADLDIPGLLVGKLVGSTVAHARIVSIDTSEAERLPGVRAVITGRDMPESRYGQLISDQPFLPVDKVRYYGEPVVAIAAVDEPTAEQAARLVGVEYDELPALADADRALAPDAALVHEEASTYDAVPMTRESPIPLRPPEPGTNLLFELTLNAGDVEQAMRRAVRVFEETYTVPMVAHAAMEPHAAAAEVDADGGITVWTGSQSPRRVHATLARYFDVPREQIRVIGLKPGGGFGARIGMILEPYCVALSRAAGAPVRIVLTRIETFQTIGGWLPGRFHFRTGVDAEGRMVAREVDIVWNAGAYAMTSPVACANAALVALGPYPAKHVSVRSRLVYTNLPAARPYRGLAATQGNWAAERHVDSVARALGADPLDFRLRHLLRAGDVMPWGEVNREVHLEECVRAAAAELGWGTSPVPAGRGRGIAAMWKFTLPGFFSEAEVVLHEDARVDVYTGAVDIGTGVQVVLAQVAAEVLAVPVERVAVHMADSEYGLEDSGASASRSAVYAGNATLEAATRVRDQLLDMAERELGIPAAQLALRDGRVAAAGSPPGSGVSVAQLLAGGGDLSAPGAFRGEVRTEQTPGAPTTWQFADWKFGACAVEVGVDRETGVVDVRRVVAAHDIGRVLNRLNVETQTEGSVVMGIGAAIYEQQVFDGAQLVNPTFMDYVMPTALEAPPEVVPVLLETGSGHGPFGSHGFGELPIIPVAAAIGNAVADATGVQVRDLPITAERVLLGLDEQ